MTNQWPDDGPWNLTYTPDAFGPLLSGDSVKQAVIQTLELWLPTYIYEVNRQRGIQSLVVPLSYFYQAGERPITPGTSQATVFVPRIVKPPERYNSGRASAGTFGSYRVTWQVLVGVYFTGTQDWNESEAIAWAYEASVRGCIGQHAGLTPPGCAPFSAGTTWTGSALGKRERSSTFWRVSVVTTFHVVTSNAMSPFGANAVDPNQPSGLQQPSVASPPVAVEGNTLLNLVAVPITEPVDEG